MAETSFNVDIVMDGDQLESDVNAYDKKKNLILIDDEIISFTTILPQGGDSYQISGLLRGCYDTVVADHAVNDDMFSLDGLSLLFSMILHPGNTYYFKAIPYNNTMTGDLSEAMAVSIAYGDRSTCPRPVKDLEANGSSTGATYSTDIALTWSPQVRGSDETPTSLWMCDGLFEVQVWVGGVKKRTVQTTNIDQFFDAWMNTEAMNLEDNTTLASSVTLKVYSFVDSARYSDARETVVTLV